MPDNIYRIDKNRVHGYQVRMLRRGKSISRLFSDRKHGSKEAAYAAAVAFRDLIKTWREGS